MNPHSGGQGYAKLKRMEGERGMSFKKPLGDGYKKNSTNCTSLAACPRREEGNGV